MRSLRVRLLLAHLLVIAASTATLLIVTFMIASSLHARLMIALLGADAMSEHDPTMVAMEQATNAVFQTAMLQALLVSSSAACIVAVGVSLLMSNRIAVPIQRLLRASRHIAAGEYTERVPIYGHDELALLAMQFNTMAASLADAERRRVALIGDVAHELRTPLAVIEGYAEAALDGVVTYEESSALIIDEVARLRHLVSDLQELSRAEARQLVLHRLAVAPDTLIAQAVARLSPQYAERGVELTHVSNAHVPCVYADPDRVIQILINLLGNAIQHTTPGDRVGVEAVRTETMVQMSVLDSGEGIAAEHLEHLFERFYRVDKARARTTGGTGIGLTISKALVEAHDGQIWIESAGLGCGTCVKFTLPIASA